MQLNDKSTSDGKHRLFSRNREKLQTTCLPPWTGLSDKTLWDILTLLCTAAIPLTIGLMTLKQADTARLEEEKAQIRNEDNQKAKIMSDYLDAMTKYLLEDSAKALISNKANMIARARTLNTLRQLDANRKGQLLKFLYEASLVTQCKPISVNGKMPNCKVSKLGLNGARLDEVTFDTPIPMPGIELNEALLPNANLPGIDLTGAQLERANLKGANLKNAILTQAQLKSVILQEAVVTDAFLIGATLPNALASGADLRGSRLIDSSLRGADLTNANLDNANLTRADLRDTDFTGANLTGTTVLKDAKYNQRTKFPANFNPDGRGLIRQE